MPSAQWPAVQSRLLTRELRQMRRAAGMTLQQVAAALYLSVSKIQRMERGARVSVPELRALLEVYGITDPGKAGEMTGLTLGAAAHTWHDAYASIVHDRAYLDYLDHEAGAAVIRSFQLLVIPRLLQTGEYTRAVARAGSCPERSAALPEVLRRHQQEVLGREDPPRQFYVLDQGAIQRPVGGPGHPGIMRRQLRYLAGVAARPEVTLEVVPFAAGAHPGMNGPFTILGFDGDPGDVLYLEDPTGGSVVAEGTGLRTEDYRARFEQLRQMSPGPEPGAGLIGRAADAMPALPAALLALRLSWPGVGDCRGRGGR